MATPATEHAITIDASTGLAVAGHEGALRARTSVIALLVMVALLAIPTGLIAVALGLGAMRLPYELFLVSRRLPIAFPMHMLASGAALILIPVALIARSWPSVHRPVGRLAAVAVAVGGCTALLVALASEASAVARAGFFTQGIVWLALLVAALGAIWRRQRSLHGVFMVAMAAVASGAIWLRLVMAAALAAGLPFAPIYGAAAWACWLMPLALVIAASRTIIGALAR